MGDYRSEKEAGTSSASSSRKWKPRVLVTGFGPFGEHAVNASWEAVQQLPIFQDLNDLVELFIVQIPVRYSEVSATVPNLWKKYNPDLVVHCGVSGLLAWKNMIQIERHAHGHGYNRPDIDLRTPCKGYCVADDGEKCLTTGVNLEGLDTWMGQMEDASEEGVLMCQASDDAGRFLCEFIYYTSLRINQNATLFIHVPPLYKPFGAMEIAGSIKTVILKVLEQKNLALPEDQCVSDLQKVVLAMDQLPAFD